MKGLILNASAPFLLVLELSLVVPELQPLFRYVGVLAACVMVELLVNHGKIGADSIAVNFFSGAAGEALLYMIGGSLL